MGIHLLKQKSINFFIEDDALHCLELHQANPLSIKKLINETIPPGVILEGRIQEKQSIIPILHKIVRKLGIRKRNIQFIVPDSLVVIRKVEIPKAVQMKEIPGYLSLEIGTSIHLPFDEPVFDIHFMQETEEYKEILLFAAPKDVILEYMEVFNLVGLKPIIADISALSIYRFYYHIKEIDPEEHLLFVQLGTSSANVTIFNHHMPLFMRHFTISTEHEEDETVLEEEFIRNISEELERILNFYRFTIHKGNEQVTKIILTGKYPNMKPVKETIQEILGVSVELFIDSEVNLYSRAKKSKKQTLSPNYYVPLGLALKEVP